MNVQAKLLFILISGLLTTAGHGQDLPSAEILTADAAWCELANNQTSAEILITGEIDTSRFDLVMSIRGTRDTLVNLPSGVFTLFLNNSPGRNEYIVHQVTEYQEYNKLKNDVNDTLLMEVYPWPDMSFTAEFDSPCSPVDVVFRAKEGYPSYIWDFGDGSGAQSITNWISHTYSSQEDVSEISFETGLTVSTNHGCVDSVSSQVTIYPTPDAGFQVSPELLFHPNTTVTLTNTSSQGNWEFRWDFGDGTGSFSRDPGEHEYDSWGIYNIMMEWSTPMCRDSVERQIEIRPPMPEVAFSPDTSGCPPLSVSFQNNTLYAESYYWDFDDGSSSTAIHPSHSFQEIGSYRVKLIATGLSGTDSTEQLITVFETPVVQFEPDITETASLEEEISFFNSSTNGMRYLWDFGDGSSSEEDSPTHVFRSTGNYTVTLYAWSIEGCTDSLIREDLITILAGEGTTTFPNAFRWNGTGPTGGHWTPGSEDNTVFHPDVENATGLEMQIFTRLGHLVFETNEVYVGWDGYINSSYLAEQGVYIYRATITYSDGSKEEISGDLTFLY